MKLTVIGNSGSFPGPDSAASCYLLEQEDSGRVWRILLDLGSGALGPLQAHVDPFTIDAVFLSHLHADHCLDLCGYHVMRRYHPRGAPPRIPVWGPGDVADRMARAYDLPTEPGMREEFDFAIYDQPVRVGPFTVTPRAVSHPVEAYGLRVEAAGRVLAYSGDTGVCTAIDELAREADVFLCEASFQEGADNPPNLHLTGREAGATATRAQVRRLLLTHIPPWHDQSVAEEEARASYQGPVEVTVPGGSYIV